MRIPAPPTTPPQTTGPVATTKTSTVTSAPTTQTTPTPLAMPPVPKAVPPSVAQGAPGNLLEIRQQTGKTKGNGKGNGVVDGGTVDPAPVALRPEVQQFVSAATKRYATEGYRGLAAYVAQQELIGQTSRMHSGARALHDLDLSLNKTLLGGEPAVAARLAEIDQLLLTALMTPEQSGALQEEHVALKALREVFAPLQARRDDIERVTLAGTLGPTLALTSEVERTALNALIDGGRRLEATVADAEGALQTGGLDAAAERQTGLIRNVVDAAAAGTTGIAARLAGIAHTRMVARLTPEGQETLNIEEKVLSSLARELEKA